MCYFSLIQRFGRMSGGLVSPATGKGAGALKAKQLDLMTMLRPEPEQGRLFLNSKRVLVVNTAAMGTLRKDLISSLGLDRTRGFLTRYGWSCGYHDALDLKDHFPSEQEWFWAAPFLHTLEGVALARVTHSEVDKSSGTFHVEGVWTNSYESEQHLLHFGLHSAPVCWTLCGYAGGYGSAYMGRRVLYREVTCVGRGDPECRFVGKALSEWGDEVQAELPYYQESKIGQELEQANHLLRTTAAVHEELSHLVLEGKGVPEITERLARLLGRPVAVQDEGGRLLAAYPPDAPLPPRPEAGEPRPRRPAPLPGEPPWLCTPVVAGSRLLGYVYLLLRSRSYGDLETAVLDRAATVYALEFMKQRTVAEVEQRTVADVLYTLLSGDFQDEEIMIRRAAAAGLDLQMPRRVLLARLGWPDEAPPQEERHRLLTAAAAALPGAAVALRGGELVAICRAPADWDVAVAAQTLRRSLAEALPGANPAVAAGTPCMGAREYALSYTRARQALEILGELSHHEGVLVWDDLGPYAALFTGTGARELADWAGRLLQPLLDHDRKKGGELLPTLQTYLHCDCSLQATARAASLHLSGLKYRLSKIEDLLGLNLGRTQTQFQLHLALLVAKIARISG